jgi:hypothetical protein
MPPYRILNRVTSLLNLSHRLPAGEIWRYDEALAALFIFCGKISIPLKIPKTRMPMTLVKRSGKAVNKPPAFRGIRISHFLRPRHSKLGRIMSKII